MQLGLSSSAILARKSWPKPPASGPRLRRRFITRIARVGAHGRVRCGESPWPFAGSNRMGDDFFSLAPPFLQANRFFDGKNLVERVHRHFDIGEIDAAAVGLDPRFLRYNQSPAFERYPRIFPCCFFSNFPLTDCFLVHVKTSKFWRCLRISFNPPLSGEGKGWVMEEAGSMPKPPELASGGQAPPKNPQPSLKGEGLE